MTEPIKFYRFLFFEFSLNEIFLNLKNFETEIELIASAPFSRPHGGRRYGCFSFVMVVIVYLTVDLVVN